VQRSLRPCSPAGRLPAASTPALDAHCAALNPRRAVFPEPALDAPPPTPARPDRIVIGWAGSRASREICAR
jgi:hypothetical protein